MSDILRVIAEELQREFLEDAPRNTWALISHGTHNNKATQLRVWRYTWRAEVILYPDYIQVVRGRRNGRGGVYASSRHDYGNPRMVEEVLQQLREGVTPDPGLYKRGSIIYEKWSDYNCVG